jgi:hypothetical protein
VHSHLLCLCSLVRAIGVGRQVESCMQAADASLRSETEEGGQACGAWHAAQCELLVAVPILPLLLFVVAAEGVGT